MIHNPTPGHRAKKKKTKMLIEKDTRTLMLTEAVFTIAKTWKQLKCPSTGI